MAVLRAVFNSYDSSKTGELMRQDYMRILRDRNQAGIDDVADDAHFELRLQ